MARCLTLARTRASYSFFSIVTAIAGVVFALDVILLFIARPLHISVFEGELGLIELLTFVLLLATVPMALQNAFRSQGFGRAFFVLLALGCFYWAGEEVSWGQTFFHWATPQNWAAGNYQKETNLHNERGIVGTLLNQTPRFILNATTVLCVLIRISGQSRFRAWFAERIAPRWFEAFIRCWIAAALAVGASLINKFKPLGYVDFGESHELFIALFLSLFVYLQLQWGRASRLG